MNSVKKICPQNFQVWVAFLMGMVVIIIAIVVFNNMLGKSRIGYTQEPMKSIELETKGIEMSINPYQTTVNPTQTVNPIQTVSLTSKNDEPEAWLGIEPSDLSEDIAKELGLKVKGVLVSRVIPNSPAEAAGLLRGDILYEFDYREVKDSDRLSTLIGKLEPGDRVKIALFRNNERLVVYALLGEKESTPTDNSNIKQIAADVIPTDQRLGIVVSELMGSLRVTYGIPDNENGVLVLMVIPGSPAEAAGLKRGDLIKQVNKIPVYKLSDFFEALQASNQRLVLNVVRQGSEFYITVAIADINTPSKVLDGYVVAQEGIGMNRPIYVPGYDQTQSGDVKTTTTKTTDLLVF